MEVVIVAGGMPFGPRTTEFKSLGGSETAVNEVAKEMAKLGHQVTIFCVLPAPGEVDYVEPGTIYNGVRYAPIEQFVPFSAHSEIDLLIASRDPRAVAQHSQAKKKVLWCHDVATHRVYQTSLEQMAWTFDEVWCVSEWHREQFAKVSGYPLKNIRAFRNGIIPIETMDMGKNWKQLVFAARPERGLGNCIEIMKLLPDYTLKVCMYGHFPDHMKDYYADLQRKMAECKNIEFVGQLPQKELRQLIRNSAFYLYPTEFEETSCILARECIEQGTIMLTTRTGALPETLQDCALFVEDFLNQSEGEGAYAFPFTEWSQEDKAKHFAAFVRWIADRHGLHNDLYRLQLSEQAHFDTTVAMSMRHDLYWDDVAKAMIDAADPKDVSPWSHAWSLVQDGDVIPARAFIKDWLEENYGVNVGCNTGYDLFYRMSALLNEIERFYPFILDPSDARYETLASYYKRFYAFKAPEVVTSTDNVDHPRWQAIAAEVARLPAGSKVVEYGCGEGHVIGALAKRFPQIEFFGYDQVSSNIDHVNGLLLSNLRADYADDPKHIEVRAFYDMAICTEVLEHCVEPWVVLTGIEALVRPGGRVVGSVPYGPWEPMSFNKSAEEYPWRNHIWAIDKGMIRHMMGKKPGMEIGNASYGHHKDARAVGSYMFAYDADHIEIAAVDPLAKAMRHRARQTVGAAVIAYNNAETILRMLNSISQQVQTIRIAHGPSTDNTEEVILDWADKNPWCFVDIVDAPLIHLPKDGDAGFGFDDARALSVKGLEDIHDWILWIDTDEYLSGDFRPYIRQSALDSYQIPQHHFTVQPREAPAQMDRPARLFRSNEGFQCVGHIHEHFELPSGGPGYSYCLPNVDLGHTGYVNEEVRRVRFARNFPFLEWDVAAHPQRKLNKYLWLRDIVHRMRFSAQQGDQAAARQLAEEAVKYHQDHREEMSAFGQGTFLALGYEAEAKALLGRGVPIEIGVRLDDRNVAFGGRFESVDEIKGILERLLGGEFERRLSRYF